MAATGDSVRQAVDLDNLIQEYMHFEKVSELNIEKEKTVSVFVFSRETSRLDSLPVFRVQYLFWHEINVFI